ncbi:hypothetical protein GY12_12780 [Micrococcus luteus]|nr:hypothetical protein GY12_12780 [Micrococcus luteus]
MTGARAVSTSPEAARVARPFSSASQDGNASAKPAGSSRPASRSYSRAFSGWASRQAWNAASHPRRYSAERSAMDRAPARSSGSTSKVVVGSSPRPSFRPATSSVPSLEPWMPPVFCFVGEGQPITVRSLISEGRPVSALAATRASYRASTSSVYSVTAWPWAPLVQSTSCTCQP